MKPNFSTHTGRFICSVAAVALIAGTVPCVTAFAAQRPSRGNAGNTPWSIELDCGKCHAAEVASLVADETTATEGDTPAPSTAPEKSIDTDDTELPQATGHEGYAAGHVQSFGLTCASCHEDNGKLANAHKNMNSGKKATRLKKTTVSQELCLGCHNIEDLAQATADSTVLTDDNGTVINPHNIPEGSEHGTLTCTDCHKVHEQEKTLAQTAKTACTSCHHAGVFECNTCH